MHMSVVKEMRYNGWLIWPSPWPGRHIRQLLRKVLPDKCALLPVIATKKTVQHIVRQLQIQHVPICIRKHARTTHRRTHARTHTHARARTRTHTAHMHIPYRASRQIAVS